MYKEVPGVGPKNCSIAIVGEAPGQEELVVGQPFVGQAGRKFDSMLMAAGISRRFCYITNVFKRKAPNNKTQGWLDYSKKHPIESDYYLECKARLKAELEKTEANVIVAAGGDALWTLCGLDKISKRRGSILESTLLPGRKVIPILHPAVTLYRDPKAFHLIITDLERVLKQSEFPEIVRPNREFILEPTIEDVTKYLYHIKNFSTPIAIDIEVINEELSHIGISTRDGKYAMCIPFVTDNRNVWDIEEEQQIMSLLSDIMQDRNVHKINQNILFDISFLFERYGIITQNTDDTMIAQAFVNPDLGKDLGTIVSLYTEEPYYKDDLKQWKHVVDGELKFREYNAKDAAVCSEIFPIQLEDLEVLDNIENYKKQRDLIPPLLYMSQRGIKIDQEKLKQRSEEAAEIIAESKEKLNSLCGYEINPNSPMQLIDYFYKKKGIPPYMKNKRPTTDVDAMKRLAKGTASRKGLEEASLVLKIRHYTKRKSTYYDINLRDGRLVSSFNPVGTKQHRLSSSRDIFGRGTNMENQPEEMQEIMIADDGYIMYQCDLSNGDNRVVAYIAPEPQMIKAFESGEDLHRLTAGLILDKPPEEVSEEVGTCFMCPDPSTCGHKGERYGGKKSNHGFNYGWGHKQFAYKNDILEKTSMMIRNKYLNSYKGIENYWRWVQEELQTTRQLTNCFGATYRFLGDMTHELYNQGYSYIPQSTVADIINWWCVLYLWNNWTKVELLNQIHDSVVFQIPISAGWAYHANVLKGLKNSAEQPVTFRGNSFSIPLECEMGFDLKNTKEVDLNNNIPHIVKQLENNYFLFNQNRKVNQ